MPIYEYRCTECGFQKEFLQKVSDPKLTTCTQCGKETFEKMLTAAGFQLKGSGWYATDFRGGSGGTSAPATGPAGEAAPADSSSSSGSDSGSGTPPCGSSCACH